MQVRSSQPKLVVTSSNTFWDSKEAVEGQLVQDSFLALKDSGADQVEIGAAIYNEPVGAKLLRKAPGAFGSRVAGRRNRPSPCSLDSGLLQFVRIRAGGICRRKATKGSLTIYRCLQDREHSRTLLF